MSGLLYPKEKRKKKRRKHSPSILQSYDNRCCFLCAREGNTREYKVLQEHHIFEGTANRRQSEAYGLKVRLCLLHHMYSDVSVHGNKEVADKLHRLGQEAFEREHSREEFMQIFGRNYLDG